MQVPLQRIIESGPAGVLSHVKPRHASSHLGSAEAHHHLETQNGLSLKKKSCPVEHRCAGAVLLLNETARDDRPWMD